jgi:hypothetical protein
MIKIFVYWDKGYIKMPPLIKEIYQNNLYFCNNNNLDLILLDDNNIFKFIEPHSLFNNLASNFKSDIVRYYVLNKYGGFWLDTDIIIIKDLNNLYNKIIASGKELMADIEIWDRIGCQALYIRKNSFSSEYCVEYVNDYLNKNKELFWHAIGPNAVRSLYQNYSDLIYLNDYETVKKGCNYITYNDMPGYYKEKWYLTKKSKAKQQAKKIFNQKECFYVVTWDIYKQNNIKEDLGKYVLQDKKSIFSYFINNYYENTYYDIYMNRSYLKYNVKAIDYQNKNLEKKNFNIYLNKDLGCNLRGPKYYRGKYIVFIGDEKIFKLEELSNDYMINDTNVLNLGIFGAGPGDFNKSNYLKIINEASYCVLQLMCEKSVSTEYYKSDFKCYLYDNKKINYNTFWNFIAPGRYNLEEKCRKCYVDEYKKLISEIKVPLLIVNILNEKTEYPKIISKKTINNILGDKNNYLEVITEKFIDKIKNYLKNF